MRIIFAIFVALALGLSACGGGGAGESKPGPVPTGSISGTAFDGLIFDGTVRVYDFSGGSQGALLGSAVTDANGLYSLSLAVESRPILITITGGSYIEERSGTNVALDNTIGHRLTAVTNFTTGSTLRVAVTTYTHLAAGLSAYQIRHGTPVASAIDNSNSRFSALVGTNILTTTPRDITNPANASGALTPALRYGFLAGAISLWTYDNTPPATIPHFYPYTSIDFAQLLYNDITTDGLLDGQGRDDGGNLGPLSFGTVLLDADTFRFHIGASLIRMATHSNNKTSLTGPLLRPFAEGYIQNADPVFAGIKPRNFVVNASIVSPFANSWMRRNVNVVPSGDASTGVASTDLLVDGVVVSSSAGSVPGTVLLDTAKHADGVRDIAIRITDNAGIQTTANIAGRIDNTAPIATGYYMADPQWNYGNASDNYSGFAVSQSIHSTSTPGTVYYASVAANGSWNVSDGPIVYFGAFRALRQISSAVIRVTDLAGNCSDYGYPAYPSTSTVLILRQASACP